MIFGVDQVQGGHGPLGGLTTQLRVRVLNASASGCLVEATRALPVGTVADLKVRIFDRDYDDQVQVTRCQILAGAGSIFHIAMQFLTTVPPYAGSLRYAIHRELNQLAGWVHVADAPDAQPADSSRRRAADATDK
jgi:hypothetical protein